MRLIASILPRYVILLVGTLQFACNVDQVVVVDGRPDLVIESVSYERIPYWMPEFTFTVNVKNIGDSPVIGDFYIAYTSTQRDYDSLNCSENRPTWHPGLRIEAGGTISPQFWGPLQDSMPKVLFYINTNDAFKKKLNGPIVNEVSYDNNWYLLEMQW
jgi:hypothetical protein